MRVLISDGRLYLSLGTGKTAPKVYGGIELKRFASGKASIGNLQRALIPLPSPKRSRLVRNGDGGGVPNGGTRARVEISITTIAQELRLEG